MTPLDDHPESPLKPSLTTKPAGLLRRLGAVAYDSLLVLACWMITTATLSLLNDGKAVGGAWFQSLLLIENYLFCAWFWLKDGSTLGMKAWRMEIRSSAGSAITLNQTLIRFLIGIPSLLLFGLGYFWILIDRSNRSWNDITSRTKIIYTPKQ